MSEHPHDGAPSVETDRRMLSVSLALLAAFMAFEVAAAIVANSLAHFLEDWVPFLRSRS